MYAELPQVPPQHPSIEIRSNASRPTGSVRPQESQPRLTPPAQVGSVALWQKHVCVVSVMGEPEVVPLFFLLQVPFQQT